MRTLNLDHPEVVAKVIEEIDAGVDVYYDNRWEATECFCRFFLEEPHWVRDLRVLVLGAGVGMEAVIVGSLCKRLLVNDLAPVALELSAEQLRENGVHNFDLLSGRYETLAFEHVDIAVGSFLVYDADTASAMKTFLDRHAAIPLILVNDTMPDFRGLLATTVRPWRDLTSIEGVRLVLFEPRADP